MTRTPPKRPGAGSPGTYALVLRCRRRARLRIGRLGVLQTLPGFYVYVGSALGPGGVAARVRHHQRPAARPHWHIDYLRARADLVEVWHVHGTRRYRCGVSEPRTATACRTCSASTSARRSGSFGARCAGWLRGMHRCG